MGSAPRTRVYSIAVELTAHCNQKCSYCYNAWREDGGVDVGAPPMRELLARLGRLFDELTIDHVTLTGGEPFARADVFEVLDLLRAQKVGVQVISNGGLVTDKLASRLAPYELRYIQLTLDGPTAELHDEHTGGKGHFARTLSGVRSLAAHGVPVYGCVVMTRKNAHHVGAILDVWRSLGVNDIALSRFSPAGYASNHVAELLPSVADVTVGLEQAHSFAKDGMRIVSTMPMPPCAIETERFAPIQFGSCAIGSEYQELALGPDGRLRNCTLHKSAIGDVDVLDPSVDLAALLSSPAIKEYKGTRPAFCEGCVHERSCAGGCGAAAEWVLGDRGLPDPFLWQHVDDAFAARLAALRVKKDDKRRLEVVP
jgi:radical SAM protein with 4Fe4S-binding SPASM domain